MQNLLRFRKVTKLDWNKITAVQYTLSFWGDTEYAEALWHALKAEILQSISEARDRILLNKDALCLLKAYIEEWTKFFDLSDYFFLSFQHTEKQLKYFHKKKANSPTKANSIMRKFMQDTWKESIVAEFKECLQRTAENLVASYREKW